MSHITYGGSIYLLAFTKEKVFYYNVEKGEKESKYTVNLEFELKDINLIQNI